MAMSPRLLKADVNQSSLCDRSLFFQAGFTIYFWKIPAHLAWIPSWPLNNILDVLGSDSDVLIIAEKQLQKSVSPLILNKRLE